MKCIVKAAMSLDGYLDDSSPKRCVFSSPEDAQEVDELRASVDAILIGAQTLRLDNPQLLVRSEELRSARLSQGKSPSPIRVVLTSGKPLPVDAKVFTDTTAKSLVIAPSSCGEAIRKTLPAHVELLGFDTDQDVVTQVCALLSQWGVRSLLVEGGSQILTLFLASEVTSLFRLSISPIVLGESGRSSLREALRASAKSFDTYSLKLLGQNVIVTYEFD